MSAIAGVFGPFGATEPVVRSMLARMSQRGTDGTAVKAGDEAMVGVARFEWELEPGLAGPIHVAQHDGLVVVADATLYYRDALRAKLTRAGVVPSGPTHTHLILDAYRAWGAACANHLEGDYAFVVWDARRAEVFCCRDGVGLRPLFYGVFDRTLVVASSVAGVLTHPHASDELNVRAIAATAAGQMYSLGAETSFRGVHGLQAGHWLTWRSGALGGPTRHWFPAAAGAAGRLDFAEAADELRSLLVRAVAERVPADGVTAVWMSGGWDSTAIFAAGREALRGASSAAQLQPVCISYPDGDPGREDNLIRAVLRHWDSDATWLDSREMPLLEAPERDAASRDEAPALLYGPWHGALAEASRASGARVVFDGSGGDQLFGPMTTHFAHLLETLRWVSLAQELWAKRHMGWRSLAQRTLVPLAPRWMLPATAWPRASGKAITHYLERPLPEWIRPEFAARAGLLEFEQGFLPGHGLGVGRRDQLWMLMAPCFAWGGSRIAERTLTRGAEQRSPLLDARIIEFALARPWHERGLRRETKRLLRAAMRGLLPAEVLAPRRTRTGITTGYSRYWMRQRMPALVERLFQAPLELEGLGVVSGAALRRAADQYAGGWVDEFTRVHLYHTIEVELWLRARRSAVSAAASSAPAAFGDRAMAEDVQRSHLSHPVPLGG